MSLTGSPGHANGAYDAYESYYDPDFSAEISARMHVPDKIRLVDGIEDTGRIAPPMEVKSMMYVPDRIIVAGNNQHIAVRESIPELKFDSSLSLPHQNYVLTAPPNVLTVDEYPYPSAEFETSKPDKQKKVVLDQSFKAADLNETSLNTSCAPEEELSILRRQVRNLSRRVLTIEQENQQRQQREIILYALGVTYFLFKGLFWLHRHF
ncbi:transport and Golgi organization protein 11-like [Uloborus diversus]|uniref:transport and Golgi organization protein 11-like n=1 Tax=Uloborus diversus TaxID=327109 RepID=UPI00240A6AF9|nr:transport and Golgi organization protein 11-like [Uloborus diversus]